MATVKRSIPRLLLVPFMVSVVGLSLVAGPRVRVAAQDTPTDPDATAIPSGGSDSSEAPDAADGQAADPALEAAIKMPVPFPQLMNAVLRVPDLPPASGPETDLSILTVPALGEDGITFAIGFANAFEIPKRDYKMSLVIGDPVGARMRYVNSAGENKATVQKRDGERWVVMKNTEADVSVPGTVQILVPPTDFADGSVVWVEVEKGSGRDVETVRSPYFDLAALTLGIPKATMVSTPVGWIRSAEGEILPESVPLADSSVTISADGRSLVVKNAGQVPTELNGVAVSQAVDHIRLATGSAVSGVAPDEIQIDRISGAVKLMRGASVAVGSPTGHPSWLESGSIAANPGGPGELRLDIHAVAAALGTSLVYTDPNSLALGVERTFLLENGNVVTASGVYAVLSWFDFEPPAPEVTTTTTQPRVVEVVASEEESGSAVGTLLAVGGVLVVGVAAFVAASIAIRRRNERREAELAEDFAWADGSSTTSPSDQADSMLFEIGPFPEAEGGAVSEPSAIGEPAEEPESGDVGEDSDEPAPREPVPDESVPEKPATPQRGPEEPTSVERTPQEHAPVESETVESETVESETVESETPDEPVISPGSQKNVSPDDVLASFEAELTSITERLDRLGDEDRS